MAAAIAPDDGDRVGRHRGQQTTRGRRYLSRSFVVIVIALAASTGSRAVPMRAIGQALQAA
ncbi:hypothetical protein QSH18_12450 [Xanthomonas sp. NCPPB 2654]|uniref:hypothetical protein n=1 Tax=unclassified Xanthomonas TaxID=2643310 RepID=UPI0021E080D6|nr:MULTISPECIES: hypothetical protein [unclassified Xanthomonas]MDL5366420.1 hypothetical protein [Xanthomonas sp. NCPPB 2654]UYC22420.1 hypothetical protein NUG20_09095 [Xanthomonas sp. CFBP 8443]